MIRGVVAFHSPARTEETFCSPYAYRVNGPAFINTALTARCPHTRPRGSGSAARDDDHEQGGGAQRDAPERDVDRRPVLAEHLDPEKARPPHDREGQELRAPDRNATHIGVTNQRSKTGYVALSISAASICLEVIHSH